MGRGRQVAFYVWLIFGIVFIASSFIFYKYWIFTKVNKAEKTQQEELSAEQEKQLINAEKDIYILEKSNDIPAVFVRGQITDYKLIESLNSSENKTSIYVVLSTREGDLPVRIDNITFWGKEPKTYFVVENINEIDKNQIVSILDDAKSLTSVENTYLTFLSIQDKDQIKSCQSMYPGSPESWCQLRQVDNFLSAETILNLVRDKVFKDSQYFYSNENIDYSKFLDISDKVLNILQVNYYKEDYTEL